MVATPIGNLGDITLRALETLKSVDTVACEDTRHTLKLLSHFDIHKPLISCHANDERRGAERVVSLLDEGKDVAYCSDAGTPGLSDPGAVVVREARRRGHKVVPVPGPSAFACLVSAAGVSGRTFLFDGFLSPKPGKRRTRLKELLLRGESFVLYESPFRVGKLLTDIASIDPNRLVCIGRELTKIHEEIIEGTAAELAARFPAGSARGEFCLIVRGLANEPSSGQAGDDL
ncbi:MAG: 16S rRNA (cytidine(1402)-2'-O)-methyltransferase [Rectinema sp.]|jgi:16S rRNA (cytidine1402-2'-O)-methyltransferase